MRDAVDGGNNLFPAGNGERAAAAEIVLHIDHEQAILHRGKPLPYRSNIELPPSVRDHLPPHAQYIYRAAFNHAFAAHAGDVRQEEIAHRTAWAAVKRSYVKDDDRWVPIE